MRRRNIIRSLVTIVGAFVSPRVVRSQEGNSVTNYAGTIGIWEPKNAIDFHVTLVDRDQDHGVRSITVEYSGEKIVLTAREIFEALKGE